MFYCTVSLIVLSIVSTVDHGLRFHDTEEKFGSWLGWAGQAVSSKRFGKQTQAPWWSQSRTTGLPTSAVIKLLVWVDVSMSNGNASSGFVCPQDIYIIRDGLLCLPQFPREGWSDQF